MGTVDLIIERPNLSVCGSCDPSVGEPVSRNRRLSSGSSGEHKLQTFVGQSSSKIRTYDSGCKLSPNSSLSESDHSSDGQGNIIQSKKALTKLRSTSYICATQDSALGDSILGPGCITSTIGIASTSDAVRNVTGRTAPTINGGHRELVLIENDEVNLHINCRLRSTSEASEDHPHSQSFTLDGR